MDAAAFFKLLCTISPHMDQVSKRQATERQKKTSSHRKRLPRSKVGARNGIIPHSSRLSMALRWFAGGAVYDIALVHGVAICKVYKSIWLVVDAVNECKELKIEFPREHNKQEKIAEGFFNKSLAGISTCVGAIDGVLIWIEKPTVGKCEEANCGPRKFFCDRKKKFGLNMQGTVDSRGRFLDVSIAHPGSTSDFLAFETRCPLKNLLETEGFLAPGLALFGDAAYVNSKYMVTPYKSASGTQDDFNYFHSNLRITVECSFGMLMHRWGVLCRPIHASIGVPKSCALVMSLCCLHNFCIDENVCACTGLARDELEIQVNGGIPLVDKPTNHHSPEQLLHGGEHLDDVSPNLRRHIRRRNARDIESLPRDHLHSMIVDKGLQRPTPVHWRNK